MCKTCNSAPSGLSYASYVQSQQPQTIVPCVYTLEMLQDWKTKLECVKQNNILDVFKISNATLNSYLGYVISAINYSSNICYFKPQLDLINILILRIVNSGQC